MVSVGGFSCEGLCRGHGEQSRTPPLCVVGGAEPAGRGGPPDTPNTADRGAGVAGAPGWAESGAGVECAHESREDEDEESGRGVHGTGLGGKRPLPAQPHTPLSQSEAGMQRLRKTRPSSSIAVLPVWPAQKYSASLDLSFCICKMGVITGGASLIAQLVKNLAAMQEAQIQSLGQDDPPEKR